MSKNVEKRLKNLEMKKLYINAEDTLVMRINGKVYTYKTIAEGNQALIEISRATP